MRSITECFELIKKEIQDLNYSLFDRFQEPVDSKLIKKTESDLRLKFNEELIELYSCSNGTSLDLDTPIGNLCYIPIYIFMSLQDATEYHRNNISGLQYLFTVSTIKEPGFKFFPVFQDGGGASYWMDLNSGSTHCNKILWTPIPVKKFRRTKSQQVYKRF
jgi:hypothetical protein